MKINFHKFFNMGIYDIILVFNTPLSPIKTSLHIIAPSLESAIIIFITNS